MAEPDFIRGLLDNLKIPGAGAAGASVFATARFLFTHRQGDIPVCTTRVLHGEHGFPWERLLALHPLENGQLEIKFLDPPPKGRTRKRKQ